jgi:hypothetical protein
MRIVFETYSIGVQTRISSFRILFLGLKHNELVKYMYEVEILPHNGTKCADFLIIMQRKSQIFVL